MVERPVSLPKTGGMLDGSFEVGARRSQRLVGSLPERQMGGNGRGERAPGAMRVPRLEALSCQVELGVWCADDVDDAIAEGLPRQVREIDRTRSSVAASGIGVPLLDELLQPVERDVPEQPVPLEPILDLAKAFGARAEHAELPFDAPLDDAGFFKNLEMSGDCWPRYLEWLGKLACSQFALFEQLLDDGKARRIGKSTKDRVQHIISIFC